MLFKNSVRTSKRTPHFTITKINWLTLFKFNQTSFTALSFNIHVDPDTACATRASLYHSEVQLQGQSRPSQDRRPGHKTKTLFSAAMDIQEQDVKDKQVNRNNRT
jgi:hypothetical protein